MTQDLVAYWSRLEDNIHPDDRNTFSIFGKMGFETDHPPPAYIGDILNAPIMILLNQGAYIDDMVALEFPDQAAQADYRDRLKHPRPVDIKDPRVSRYYTDLNYACWLQSGEAAIVNGVAYRTRDSGQKDVKEAPRLLPSARFHQNWLCNHLLPAVTRGERFVIVHNKTAWNGATDCLSGNSNAVFAQSPYLRNQNLSPFEIEAASAFLAGRA